MALSASGRRKSREQPSSLELTDTEYEFLFMQLMEGIGHGWHEGRILKFFEKLGERGKAKPWMAWIERFGEKVMASEASNQMLGARMMRLGELGQNIIKVQKIAEVSYQVGQKIYSKNTEDNIWEYGGPDANVTPDTVMPSDDGMGMETLTIEQLLERLQEDPNLAQVLAKQLGIETIEPQQIIDTLVQQFQQTQNQLESENLPETVEDWFQRGLNQADLADWAGAIASWEQALELNPNLVQAWHNRGTALAHLGQLDEALVSVERAIELDPDDYQLWNSRGSILFSLQHWQESLACWEKVIALQSDYYQGWYNQGFTLENLGRTEEAINSYQKAIEINPEFELAKAKLSDLLENKEEETDLEE
jgi:tetratricopeptide (TPR) repeat protein